MTKCLRIPALVLLVSVILPFYSPAQSYTRAIGIRFSNGENIGFSYVERLGKKFTLEGILEGKMRAEF